MREPDQQIPRRAGMTLIELIFVMALLSVVAALSAPSLAPFFRGRTLDAEAHRFLALTRYVQSEAISCGVPIEFWVEPSTGAYGVRIQPGYDDGEAMDSFEKVLDNTLHVEIAEEEQTEEETGVIRYLPDGTRDGQSIGGLTLSDGRGRAVRLELGANGSFYEINRAEAP